MSQIMLMPSRCPVRATQESTCCASTVASTKTEPPAQLEQLPQYSSAGSPKYFKMNARRQSAVVQ